MRCLALLLCLCLVVILPAAQVHLADGRTLEGSVTIHEDGRVDITIRSGGITGIVHLAAEDVLAIDHSVSSRAQALEDVENAYCALLPTPDPAAVWTLAERLQVLQEPIAFRQMAQRVLEVDPNHVEARAALGYQFYEGNWMKEAEVARAKGLIFHEGRWITQDEYDRLQAESLARQERLAALREEQARRYAQWQAARQVVPQPVVVGVHSSYPVYDYGCRDTVMNRYWPLYVGPSLWTSPVPCSPVPGFQAGFHLQRDNWSLDLGSTAGSGYADYDGW